MGQVGYNDFKSQFTNAAIGKDASQSSLSPWSSEMGARGVLLDEIPLNFGFHTNEDEHPWWELGLDQCFPIAAIVIYNRVDGFQEKARTMSVEISTDAEEWTTIHSGLVHFGSGTQYPPLVLPLQGQVSARYLRLALHERSYFHLAKVEVWVEEAIVRAKQIRETYGLCYPLRGQPDAEEVPAYIAVAASRNDLNGPLIGLYVDRNGLFGNSVFQYANAVELAQSLGLKYIKVAPGGLLAVSEPISIDDITFLPANAELPAGGCFLQGYFFTRKYFVDVLKQNSVRDYNRTIQKYCTPLFGQIPSHLLPPKPVDEFVIHIRSGDIFSSWVHPDYVQPPLAFYKIAVRTLIHSHGVTCIKLVFEDRMNPVIDALEAWLVDEGIALTCQTGALVDDISALIDARHLAFGIGTFGIAICHFSKFVKTVFYFSPNEDCPYDGLPNVGTVYHVRDEAKCYIKVGDWRNTDDQRRLMISYPEDMMSVVKFNNSGNPILS